MVSHLGILLLGMLLFQVSGQANLIREGGASPSKETHHLKKKEKTKKREKRKPASEPESHVFEALDPKKVTSQPLNLPKINPQTYIPTQTEDNVDSDSEKTP